MIRVGETELPWQEGMTVADALEAVGDNFPYPVVRIGPRYVARKDFARTPVPDNAEIFPISMIAGG